MKNQAKVEFNNLLDVAKRFPTEQSCREFLAQARWNGRPVCVHCGYSEKIYTIANGSLYKCAKCRKPFSVKVGTIFEDSALPLQKWFFAMFMVSAHKKGISSYQLSRDLGVTQKTAWHMLHRIRFAMTTKSFNKPLNGIVEADETYIGGKSHGVTGRGALRKTPVFGAVERGGRVIAKKVEHTGAKDIQPIMRKHISPDAIIMTDEWHAYKNLEDSFDSHETVNHGKKEYVRGDIHTNTIENFWSMLKRGIIGIYHHVDKKHLDQYVEEFAYRYNSRNIKDVERFVNLLSQCAGRLTYAKLIQK
jgi:transposase-like protein